MTTLKLLSWKKLSDNFTYELVIEEETIFSKLLFWKKNIVKKITYRGNCTVWHKYPSGYRASTHRESALSNFWTRVKMEEQDQEMRRKQKS